MIRKSIRVNIANQGLRVARTSLFFAPKKLLTGGKHSRVKDQGFTEVGQKILGAVVAGIQVEFVGDAFCLKLPVKFLGANLKSEFIFIAAVEIDGQPCRPNRGPVLLREDKRAVLVPMMEINRIAEYGSE